MRLKPWVLIAIIGTSAFLAFLGAFLIVVSQNPTQPAGGLLVYGP
jgi:hypothetical protein